MTPILWENGYYFDQIARDISINNTSSYRQRDDHFVPTSDKALS